VDRTQAQDWLDRYVAAWLTYEPDLIGDLFSEDVAYRYHPYDEPVLGREAVVASWLGDDTPGASSRDPLGTYDDLFARRSAVLDQVYSCKMPLAGAEPLTASERADLLG